MMSDIMKMAKMFSEMSKQLIFEHLNNTLGKEISLDDMDELLSTQSRIKEKLAEWEQASEKAEDLFQTAKDVYHDDGDADYQINVDPIVGPWELSEVSGEAHWVRGWLWVTDAELNFYRKHRKKKNE